MTVWPFLYKGMLIVPLNDSYAIHVHHWMVYLPLAILALVTARLAVAGFAGTMVVHGLLVYQDRFAVVVRSPWTERGYPRAKKVAR